MQIFLNQFEQYIDDIILQRGLSYFRAGCVTQFDEITKWEFEAIVEGTEDYTVHLIVENNILTDYSCTCPYEYGPVCKHIAAVLFYMQKEELDLQHSKHKKTPGMKKVKTKRKTVKEQVEDLLNKLSHDDLKEFLKVQSLADPSFRRQFLSGFTYKFQGESQSVYKQQIKSILRAAKGRSDFIDWSGIRRVGNEVDKMLNIAGKHIENENYQSAVFICLAILDEMIETINYTDDSNGDIGGTIETALDLLGAIASVKLPENVRVYLLERCQIFHKKESFSGWGWDITLLHIASQLVKSEKEADTIFSLLDNSDISEFNREHAEEIKYELIKKMKGDHEADKFLAQYISNPELRRTAIKKAIEDKNFEKAVSLANDGIKCDTEDKPGLALEWYDWLLRIALIQKDTTNIIGYARFLFVDGFRHDQHESRQ